MPLFGEKGVPASSILGTNFWISVDEFRRSSHTISLTNPASITLGLCGTAGGILANYLSKRPLIAGTPSMIFATAFGVWAGYYLTRAHHQYYMGRFKYCLEYALSRKDMFPMKVKPKFSDPEVLEPFFAYSRPKY